MTDADLNVLRRDPLSRKWILYLSHSSDRATIEDELKRLKHLPEGGSDKTGCPICSNQHQSEVIVDLIDGRFVYHNNPQALGWSIRVQPYFSPLFRIEGALDRRGERLYDTIKAQGAHELVILSNEHDKTLFEMGAEDYHNILLMVRERMIDLQRDDKLGHLIFFINHGSAAGCNFKHPHGQILATPFVPEKVQKELRGAQEWYAHKERCLFCDIINDELDRMKEGKPSQIIGQNDGFLAIMPHFGSYPFETWLIPREHNSDYKNVSAGHLLPLAELITGTLKQLYSLVGEISFSLYLLTQPNKRWGQQRNYWMTVENDWHWRLLIVPKIPELTQTFDDYFEGVGSRVNPVLPEIAAELMRAKGSR